MNLSLSPDRLRELLHYDPLTGVFVWKVMRAPLAQIGNEAGRVSTKGYRHISVDGTRYSAHRLAWLYVYDRWPDGVIDHINGAKSDNRIENLRDVTNLQNSHNQHRARSNSQTGVLGVVPSPLVNLPFRAELSRSGKSWLLGYFSTLEEAAAARKGAEAVYSDLITFKKD